MADIKAVTFNSEAFCNHMKRKSNLWKPSMVDIGPDFAVYLFDTLPEMHAAHEDALEYNGYYKYGIDVDYAGKRFVIINPNQEKEDS